MFVWGLFQVCLSKVVLKIFEAKGVETVRVVEQIP